MLNNEMNLSGAWTLYYGENSKVKNLGIIATQADAKHLIPDSVPAIVPGNFERDLERAGKRNPYDALRHQ